MKYIFSLISFLQFTQVLCYAQNHGYEMGSCLRNLKSRQIINPLPHYEKTEPINMPGNVAHQIYEKKYIKSLTDENKDKSGESLNLMWK